MKIRHLIFMTFLMFIMCVNIRANDYFFKRPTPFTVAVCLEGTCINSKTKEAKRFDPQIDFMTVYDDKIIMQGDNVVYDLKVANDQARLYRGPLANGLQPVIILNPNLDNCVMNVDCGDSYDFYLCWPFYVMEMDKFNELVIRMDGISNDVFINNSNSSTEKYLAPGSSSAGSKSYYKSRYGYKNCHSCGGDGICKSCNGSGYFSNSYGTSEHSECPNCIVVNGRKSGKCGRCHGTGKVYGVK